MSQADNKNVSRFYSLALGKFKNFQTKTDGLIGEGAAIPDVSANSLLYANNSSTIVITNLTNGSEGQLVKIINLGSSLSFNGSNFYLSDSSNLAKNDNITFISHNNVWYEEGRAHSGQLSVRYASELGADNQAPDITNASVLVINNSGATILAGLSGGYIGQGGTLVNIKSAVTLSHNACILNQGSGGVGYILLASGAVTVVNVGSRWLPVREAYSGANPA